MRTLIKYIILSLLIFDFACKKKKEVPETPATTNNIATTLTLQEQKLVGNWTMDSVAYYSSSTWQSSLTTGNIYLVFKSTAPSTGCLPLDSSYYYAIGSPCCGAIGAWSAKQNNILLISTTSTTPCISTNTILSLSSNSLAYKYNGPSSGQISIEYYHK